MNGDSSLDLSGGVCISEDVHQSLRRSILEEGDVLLTIAGADIGKRGIVEERYLPANTNQAVGIMRVDQRQVAPRFLYYWFKQPQTFRYIQRLSAQAAQSNINLSMLRNIEVAVPSMSEQQQIVSILSTYDDLIENNRRRIQLLEQAARLLYKEWFIRLRFPGHEHTPIVNGVPKGWEKKKLGDVADTKAENHKASTLPNEINYIDISSVKQGRVLWKNKMPSSEALEQARRKGTDGDVFGSNVRPNLRAYALVLDPDENNAFSTGFTILSPVAVPFSYLYLFVTTDDFVGHLVNHTTGASYPAVRSVDFERAKILLPTQNVLKIFHKKTKPVFRMMQVLEKEINALAHARDLLLPKRMSGEVAV